jgi:hypothetical protein
LGFRFLGFELEGGVAAAGMVEAGVEATDLGDKKLMGILTESPINLDKFSKGP